MSIPIAPKFKVIACVGPYQILKDDKGFFRVKLPGYPIKAVEFLTADKAKFQARKALEKLRADGKLKASSSERYWRP